jgi:hypothetical protein
MCFGRYAPRAPAAFFTRGCTLRVCGLTRILMIRAGQDRNFVVTLLRSLRNLWTQIAELSEIQFCFCRSFVVWFHKLLSKSQCGSSGPTTLLRQACCLYHHVLPSRWRWEQQAHLNHYQQNYIRQHHIL